MIYENKTLHLVKSEDLNHHWTLFAGRMAEWMVEACYIAAARLYGKPEDLVCVKVHGLTFKKPATKGDIIEIVTRISHVGDKSITVTGDVFVNSHGENISASVNGMATFVTVNKENKSYSHGIKLEEKYIKENKELLENTKKLLQK